MGPFIFDEPEFSGFHKMCDQLYIITKKILGLFKKKKEQWNKNEEGGQEWLSGHICISLILGRFNSGVTYVTAVFVSR